MLTETDVLSQTRSHVRWLRFSAPVEQAFTNSRHQAVWERAWLVALSGLGLFLVYCWLDAILLPEPVHRYSIPIRLFGIVPIILIAVIWRGWGQPSARFSRYYAFTYLWGSLGIVLLIGIARGVGHPMPYDGLLTSLMFGYFVMGLSFRAATSISTVIVAAYLLIEWRLGIESKQWWFNFFFLGTANTIGMVGAWLQEAGQRSHFLDRCLLEFARGRAEKESNEKSRFLAVASHDLRQPLHVINLLLENLQWQGEDAQRQRTITQLKTTVDHLNRLLRSLLDISRLNEGLVQPELRAVPVMPLLNPLIADLREQTCRRGVALELVTPSAPATVRADAILLERILRNLVTNAIEHSGGQHIVVTLEQRGVFWQFRVEDNGRGIPAERRQEVFSEFFQLPESSQPFRGLGLGLAIVRQLSQLMGGDCGLASSPLGGACFWVQLPACDEPATDTDIAAVMAGQNTQQGIGILLIEDHPVARQELAALLAGWGFRVRVAGSVQEGLTSYVGSSVRLVLTDYHLPDGTGLELLRVLRESGESVPAIILTADAELKQADTAGLATAVLHKPLSPAKLRAAIERVLRHERSALMADHG